MKTVKVSVLGVLFVITASFMTACHKTTKVEREVVVGPGSSVTQDTTVDKEVTTGIKDGDVKVETKVDLK